MKNLKNLNLVELNAQEIMKIEGGAWPKWVKGGLIGYIASELIDNWDDFEKGFSMIKGARGAEYLTIDSSEIVPLSESTAFEFICKAI